MEAVFLLVLLTNVTLEASASSQYLVTSFVGAEREDGYLLCWGRQQGPCAVL